MVKFQTPWTWLLAAVLAASGCAVQPPAATPLPQLPSRWEGQTDTTAPASTSGLIQADPLEATWWTALNDSALNALMAAAMQSSPTLGRALARLDEARAGRDAQAAARWPQVQGTLQAGRGTTASASGAAQTSASLSQSLNWELDLFGRIRHNQAAAEQRLLGATADARGTRLTLQAQLADGVVAARGCLAQAASRGEDVRSRQLALRVTELRHGAGLQSSVDVARARSAMADAQTSLATTEAQCRELALQLASLSGWPAARVRLLLDTTAPVNREALPVPPDVQVALPAVALASHPAIQAALRTADAAWEDLGAAEAARRPSLSLGLLLGSNWLQVAGSVLRSTSWSLAPELGATLWDAGRGRAQVDAAHARHLQALTSLEAAVRTAVQDTELALAQAQSAQERENLALQGLQAAENLLRASTASHAAGRMSLFELEDARRGAQNARLTLIGARRDRARAWVALIRASANSSLPMPTSAPSPTRSPLT